MPPHPPRAHGGWRRIRLGYSERADRTGVDVRAIPRCSRGPKCGRLSVDSVAFASRKIKPGRLRRRRRWGWSLMSHFSQYGLLWSGKNPTCWSHAAAPIGPPIGANTC